MAQSRRTKPLLTEKNGNQASHNVSTNRSLHCAEEQSQSFKKQCSPSKLKILGEDTEVSEDIIWNECATSRVSPMPSQSLSGSRPGSSSLRRTPTPTKQITLQAVKRKEEKIDSLETIDWNDFNQPASFIEERVPHLPLSDRNLEVQLPTLDNMPVSPHEYEDLFDQREQQMLFALSSARLDDTEANISKKPYEISVDCDDRERKEKEQGERCSDDNMLTVRDGNFTYRNEHFRDLSKQDKRDHIDANFIFDGKFKSTIENGEILKVGNRSTVRKGENVIGRHAMDKCHDTAVIAEKKQESVPKSMKINEMVVKDTKSSSDEEGNDNNDDGGDNDDDEIGEKGKAPNSLLMEFLTCMMQEDYENAEKLCKMILIYEPDNPEALGFFPLIQEKRRQEEEEDDDDTESEEESDDSGEAADSDDDVDNEDSDEESGSEDNENNSSDGSEDGEGNDDDENEGQSHTDSGIVSANSDG